MRNFIISILLAFTLSAAIAQEEDYTASDLARDLTILFAVEQDALYSCPSSLVDMYAGCAQLSYHTLYATRTIIDSWFRGYSDTHWVTGWIGDEQVAVSRVFTVDDFPGEMFLVLAAVRGNDSIVVFDWPE